MMKKGSFILYDIDLNSVSFLTENQAGKLFIALAKYRLEGAEPDFEEDVALKILFYQFKEHIAINEAKYKEICEKRAQAANKRWSSNNANECKTMQKDAKLCLNDTDTETVTETVTDTVTDTVTETVTDACGAKKKTQKNNYYNRKNNVPALLQGEPAYDVEAFKRTTLNLKYEKRGASADVPL